MNQRQKTFAEFQSTTFDVVIIGGGINGAVTAAALSAQGLSVAIVDKNDFANGSSSNSSNLAWGGIKYLETGEFFLVNKLCKSRNHLMDHYPSRVKEIRFFTTINKGFRWPAWVIYIGAWFYWLIGRGRTLKPRYLSQKTIQADEPVVNAKQSIGGVEYSDCYLPGNDARFVFHFIRSAFDNGALVANYCIAKQAQFNTENNCWDVTLLDALPSPELSSHESSSGESSKNEFNISAKAVINACGPYVDGFNKHIQQSTAFRHVFSKGVHLVVRRLTPSEKVLAFFASDGRLFFVIPMGEFTCIGTTDTPVDSPNAEVEQSDRDFILSNANQLLSLSEPLTQDDIIGERVGVRPLVVKNNKNTNADWVKLSRKHEIVVDRDRRFISIFGGKITDCINVGNEVLDYCKGFGIVNSEWKKWYGEPSGEAKAKFMQQASKFPNILKPEIGRSESIAERWWRRFGKRAHDLLTDVEKDSNALNYPIPEQDYCACEIALMGREEFIETLDDFLRRRGKIALTMKKDQLLSHPGLLKVSELLFGPDLAPQKIEEYRQASKS